MDRRARRRGPGKRASIALLIGGALLIAGHGVAPTSIGVAFASPLQSSINGGDGTIYMAGYDEAIHIIDEATMTATGKINASAGIPGGLQLSHDRERFYTVSVDFQHIEVFDLAARESIAVHSFGDEQTRVRVWSIAIHPDERYLMILSSTDKRLVDRWEIEEPVIRQYDLETRDFVRDFPWPDGEVREFASFMFSPDGGSLYFMAEDLLLYDFETFEQVDKWEISTPFELGMGRLTGFGIVFGQSLYDEPGFYTGLFRTTDPVNGRRMMGIARIDLPGRTVEFSTIGPSEGVSFSLAPDRTKAYGLRQQIGDYEVWTFDLMEGRVASRRTFRGRPRMALATSTNGEYLYIYNAGNTIDVHDAETFERVRTVELDADMTGFLVLPAGASRTP